MVERMEKRVKWHKTNVGYKDNKNKKGKVNEVKEIQD